MDLFILSVAFEPLVELVQQTALLKSPWADSSAHLPCGSFVIVSGNLCTLSCIFLASYCLKRDIPSRGRDPAEGFGWKLAFVIHITIANRGPD